jgi:hypothetical protein
MSRQTKVLIGTWIVILTVGFIGLPLISAIASKQPSSINRPMIQDYDTKR